MRPNNICCIGGDRKGIIVCCVIALKCPEVRVTVLDSKRGVAEWNSTTLPIHEPDLDNIIKKCRNRNLFFSSQYDTAIKDAELIILSIDVPIKKVIGRDGKELNFQELENAAKLIAFHAESDKIIVEKSEVSARAAEKLSNVLKASAQAGVRFQVISNPEFLTEGTAIKNLLHAERIVIGCQNNPKGRAAAESLCELYERWVPRKNIIILNHWSSELYKVASYAFLAQRLCSINALATICEETGADIGEILKILGKDSRIGSKYLNASLGFGGLQNYLSNLVYMCESLKLNEAAEYWQAVIDMNDHQIKRFIDKTKAVLGKLSEHDITIWGFSYKRSTCDTRYSPAIEVCKSLLKENCSLRIYDPNVTPKKILTELGLDHASEKDRNVQVCSDLYLAISGSSAVILCTDSEEYNQLDYSKLAKWMKRPLVIDGRMFLNGSNLTNAGIEYHTIGVGRPKEGSDKDCEEILGVENPTDVEG